VSARTPLPMERRRRRPAVSARVRAEFLELLEAGWSIEWAASQLDVRKQRLYEARAEDEVFAAAWAEAYERGQALRLDVVRDEIRRRAVDGWDEPVYQRGELAGYIHRQSDLLLIFEAKRLDPAYRDNARLELTGAGGGPVELQAGYTPTSIADVVSLAGELGVLEQLGYTRTDEVEGEAVEVHELPEATS
jgi:hypothetical protein